MGERVRDRPHLHPRSRPPGRQPQPAATGEGPLPDPHANPRQRERGKPGAPAVVVAADSLQQPQDTLLEELVRVCLRPRRLAGRDHVRHQSQVGAHETLVGPLPCLTQGTQVGVPLCRPLIKDVSGEHTHLDGVGQLRLLRPGQQRFIESEHRHGPQAGHLEPDVPPLPQAQGVGRVLAGCWPRRIARRV